MGVKANIARGESQKKILGGKTKLAYIVGGYKPIYP
jgi:hypothetical protein